MKLPGITPRPCSVQISPTMADHGTDAAQHDPWRTRGHGAILPDAPRDQKCPADGKVSVPASSLLIMDFKLELVSVPVSDVDRAKAFYVDQVGFVADFDHVVDENIRFVQLTPPGSACSISIGKGLTKMAPGSLDNLQMVVADAEAARAELAGRGVAVSDVDVMPWGSFVFFSDPDGNTWALQQLPDWSKGLGGSGDSSEGWTG